MSEVLEANHAGMVFEIANYDSLLADGEIGADVPRKFTVEWYAENFPYGTFLPQLIEPKDATANDRLSASRTGLRWENESWAFYNPSFKPDRWTRSLTKIGTIAGPAIRPYGQWVVDYCTNNPGYDAFEVWDRPYLAPGQTRRWGAGSCTCSSFTQGSMTFLYEAGKAQALEDKAEGVGLDQSLLSSNTLLMRSYVPLISRSEPELVDLENPDKAREIKEFFIELRKAVGDSGGLTTSEFVRLLANKLETFYVYQTNRDAYFRVDLDAPYLAVTSLYQPISLPWQRHDLEGDGVPRDPAAFAADARDANFAVELGRAAKGVADVARRRLPRVLRKKFRQRLSDEGIAGGALVAGAGGLACLAVAAAGNAGGASIVAKLGRLTQTTVAFLSGIAVGVAGAKIFS